MSAWADSASCKGMTKEYSSHIWPDDDETSEPDQGALNAARQRCATCPVRRACFEEVMRIEAGKPVVDRAMLWAGLTPEQRHSIEKRVGMRCRCGAVRDPFLVRRGIYRCAMNCGEPEKTMPAVPDNGDRWNRRHSKLAVRIVAHLVEHTQIGDFAPAPSALARELSAPYSDVKRVYEALVSDHTLLAHGGKGDRQFLRQVDSATMKRWIDSRVSLSGTSLTNARSEDR